MSSFRRPPSTAVATAVGLAALAAAMGIGRFAFTPLLPLMQQASGLTLTQGAWLASANYLGYLVGALASFALVPRAGIAAQRGLLAVAVTTAAMGLTSSFAAWFAWRIAAGVASAFVLVGASAWALSHLAAAGRPQAAGGVFAGVGVGIVAAGLIALVAAGVAPARVWLAMGALCAAVAALVWRPLSVAAAGEAPEAAAGAPPLLDRAGWALAGCGAAFGFGYILPATFIPASARALVADPSLFGWAWPLFGLAAAASTLLVSTRFAAAPPRRVAAGSLVVMAVGVALPAFETTLATLIAGAIAVGGTFMVATMASAQEARRIAGGAPAKLMAAVTAAFAAGQVAGPLLVGLGQAGAGVLRLASVLAVLVLLAAAAALRLTETPTSSTTPARNAHV